MPGLIRESDTVFLLKHPGISVEFRISHPKTRLQGIKKPGSAV